MKIIEIVHKKYKEDNLENKYRTLLETKKINKQKNKQQIVIKIKFIQNTKHSKKIYLRKILIKISN